VEKGVREGRVVPDRGKSKRKKKQKVRREPTGGEKKQRNLGKKDSKEITRKWKTWKNRAPFLQGAHKYKKKAQMFGKKGLGTKKMRREQVERRFIAVNLRGQEGLAKGI